MPYLCPPEFRRRVPDLIAAGRSVVSIHGVRDAPLGCSRCFFDGFVVVQFAVAVVPAWRVVADLGDGGGVDAVVQPAVPSS